MGRKSKPPAAAEKKRHEIGGADAIRLLCNAIQKIHFFEMSGETEGISPACRDPGELMLQDALEYIAWGDTANARPLLDAYDEWLKTGVAEWPYCGGDPPDDDDGLPY